jgi:hypothetical protein
LHIVALFKRSVKGVKVLMNLYMLGNVIRATSCANFTLDNIILGLNRGGRALILFVVNANIFVSSGSFINLTV